MARTIAQIQAEIIAYKEAQPELAALASTSHRAIWRLWTFVIATAIAIEEQLTDIYISVIEALVARSSAASSLWIQDKMFKFQYDATDPQIIQLIDTVPVYPTVSESKRITTACSVTTSVNSSVEIKVAKSNPFKAFDGSQLVAAQNYIDTIGVAGINYTVISLAPDRIYIDANVYYNGQYSAVISTNVIAALDDYFQTLSQINFNGSLKMSDLEAVIRNVTGVTDVILNNVIGRADSVAFGSGTYYIQNSAIILRQFSPVAGYMIQEDTSGQTFADSLTFISQ